MSRTFQVYPAKEPDLTDGIVNPGDGAWEHAGDSRGAELWQAYLTEELPFDYPRERFFCPAMHQEVLFCTARSAARDAGNAC